MNELNRMKKLAGVLTESVMAVPGVGNEIDEMFDDEEESNNWAEHQAQQHDDQDVGSEFDPKLDNANQEMGECSMIEEGAFQEVIQQKLARAQELRDSMVDPEDVAEMISAELEEEGFGPDDIENIINAIADEMSDSGEDDDDICPTCNGSGEGQYDGTSCRSCGGSGVEHGERDPHDFNEPEDREYDPDDDIYEEEIEVNEDYDLNNGYDDVKFMKAGDFFPDGADSPVTSATGPSGARTGDNPEQKKLAVAETHKELVYNYRKFLKESAKK